MVLERLPENCRVDVFSQVGVEPDFATVEKAVAMMRKSQPDTIIALGGGSVLDAAKIMRLFYDWPDLKLSDVATPFLDFRQRVVKFPYGRQTNACGHPDHFGHRFGSDTICGAERSRNPYKVLARRRVAAAGRGNSGRAT